MADSKSKAKEKKEDKKGKAEEKIYNIKLTEAYKKSLRRRSPYAVRLVKDYVKMHTKAEEVKIGQKLNEQIWERGITRPARSVRVKVIKEGNIAKVEIMGVDYKEFKTQPKKEKVGMKEKLMERLGPKAIKKEEEEKKIEGKAEPLSETGAKEEIKEAPRE